MRLVSIVVVIAAPLIAGMPSLTSKIRNLVDPPRIVQYYEALAKNQLNQATALRTHLLQVKKLDEFSAPSIGVMKKHGATLLPLLQKRRDSLKSKWSNPGLKEEYQALNQRIRYQQSVMKHEVDAGVLSGLPVTPLTVCWKYPRFIDPTTGRDASGFPARLNGNGDQLFHEYLNLLVSWTENPIYHRELASEARLCHLSEYLAPRYVSPLGVPIYEKTKHLSFVRPLMEEYLQKMRKREANSKKYGIYEGPEFSRHVADFVFHGKPRTAAEPQMYDPHRELPKTTMQLSVPEVLVRDHANSFIRPGETTVSGPILPIQTLPKRY